MRVLLVEDNPLDVRLLRELLRSTPAARVEITHVERVADIAAEVAAVCPDVILLDLGLPDAHGPSAVRQTHALAPAVAIVVMTGFDDEVLASQVLKEGAQDYLMKGQLDGDALLRALRHAIQRQRMQVESELIRALQLELRDEFLSDVSHELRSPLTAIHQFASILADGLAGTTTGEQDEYLVIILRNIEQLRAMIDDLLETGRAQGGTLAIAPQCTSLADVIAYTVTTLHGVAREKQITLSFDLAPDLPSAHADPMRLRQILIILLDNAIKFTPTRGVVMLHARVDPSEPDSILVEVKDSGCGIRPEAIEKIFDRHYTVGGTARDGRRGLGLGLFICKQLVSGQGGRIWVTSQLEQGSVFSFSLPQFSLPRLIAPMFADQGGEPAAAALVSVSLDTTQEAIVDARWRHCAGETRRAVLACLTPDVELLLPEMGGPARRDSCVFVLTAADEGDVAALGRRIRKQCDELDPLRKAGLSCSVSTSVLETERTMSGASIEERIAAVSLRIAESISSRREPS